MELLKAPYAHTNRQNVLLKQEITTHLEEMQHWTISVLSEIFRALVSEVLERILLYFLTIETFRGG